MDSKLKSEQLIEKYKKMHFTVGGIGLNPKQAIECAKIAVDEIIKKSTTEKYAKEIASKYASEHGYKEDDLIVYLVYTEKNNTI